MKRILKSGAILLSSFLFFTGCEKMEDINKDVNRADEVSTPFLLTGVEKGLMDDSWDEWYNGRFGMLYAQYWAQNAYTDESRYAIRAGTNNEYWAAFYAGRTGSTQASGGIKNLEEIIRICKEQPELLVKYQSGDATNQIQIARILKVWVYQRLTDTYGMIPYSQAMKGAGIVFPKYDTQRDIYLNLIKELTEASTALDNTKESFTSGEIIYGGNVDQWKKFANSLKLRVAMRMADKEDALARTAVQEAVTAGVFQSNADNAIFRYGAGTPNNNPINEDRKERQDFAVSNVFIDTLKGLTDPRLPAFAAEKEDGGGYVGKVYGLSNGGAAAQPLKDVSQPSGLVLGATFPGVYLDYAQVEFLLAEAVERGYIAGSAEEHYNAGVTASLSFWGVGNAATSYLAQPNVAYMSPGSGIDWRRKIGVQKWIALYMQGLEGWTEWRRLDFGVLKLPAAGIRAAAKTTKIPTRYLYPSDEPDLNTANYNAAVAAQGADRQDTKLWWDAN